MPLLFDLAVEQAGECVFEAAFAGKHLVQVFGDGHTDAVLLGKRMGVVRRSFAFHRLADGGLGGFGAVAPAKRKAEAAVARLVVGAGEDEVAHARKAGQGFFFCAKGGGEAGDFAQATGNEGGAGVGTAAEAVGDACCNGDDVFDCAADLDAGEVVAGVAEEVAAVEVLGDVLCERAVGGGNGDGGRQAGGDFFGKAGPGEDGVRVVAEGVAEDIGEQSPAARFKAFDGPHERGVAQVRFEVGKQSGKGAAGDDRQYEFCRPNACREVIAHGEVGRQGDAGQVAAVFAGFSERRRVFAAVRPEGDVVGVARQL